MPEPVNIQVQRSELPSPEIYQVTGEELKKFKQGSSGSLYLNFSIALLSTAISTTISIYTSDKPPADIHASVFGLMYTGYSMGLLCLIIWYKTKNDINKEYKKVIERFTNKEQNQSKSKASNGQALA